MDLREKRADDLAKLKAEIRALPLGRVIPLAAWWRDQPWNLLWVRWFLLYALLPFFLLHGIEQVGIGHAALGFGVYFALTWLIVLTLCMRPERIDVGLLLGVALFTAIVGVACVSLVAQLPVIKSFSANTGSVSLPARWIGFLIGVGLVEEVAKA